MKKKLCAIAALSALTALPGVASAAATFDFYMRLYPQVEFIDGSDATAEDAVTASHPNLGGIKNAGVDPKSHHEVNANSSRYGFRGSVDITDNLEGDWQVEGDLDFPEREDDNVLGRRDSWLGLKGPWGQINLGNHKTPYRTESGDQVGFLGVNAGNLVSISNLMTGPGFIRESEASFHRREENAIFYWSPDFNGFSFRAQVSTDEGDRDATKDAEEVRSLGFAYERDKLSLGLGYEIHDDLFGGSITILDDSGLSGTSSEDTGIRFAVGWDFGDTEIGFVWENLEYEERNAPMGGIDSYERDAIRISVEHKIDKKLRIAAFFAEADDPDCSLVGVTCNESDLGAIHYGVGARYDLTRHLRLFTFFSVMDNDDAATYSQLAADDDQTVNAGAKESALVIGFYYRFAKGFTIGK